MHGLPAAGVAPQDPRMTETVYTFGYSGRQLSELLALCEKVNGCVVDVRYSPRSRNPTWTRKRLQEALGDRYAWLRGFGNINYRNGGPIVLAAFDEATAALGTLSPPGRSPIMLCACSQPTNCHRAVVASRVAAMTGAPVVNL
jgi:uncharacterized protein (DUF488 family)